MSIDVDIVLTNKNTSAVIFNADSNIETVSFLYYFDRIVNSLGEDNRNSLLEEFDGIVEGIIDDFTKNSNRRKTKDLGAYYLGTDYALKPEIDGKPIFKAKGKLLNIKSRLLMQTHFSPFSFNNSKIEIFAIETVHAFFHHLINNAAPRTRFIIASLLDNNFLYYDRNDFGVKSIGFAPEYALRTVFNLEKKAKSNWYKSIATLLLSKSFSGMDFIQ